MSFEIKRATRVGVRPLVSLYSESGCGKTYSSLLLARGFVGPQGKVAMVDSESGRGSLYADVLPGGYDVLELTAPFTPARYVEAIEAVEKAGYSIGLLDSGSHEWELGVLDMAAENEAKSGKTGLHCWRQPKLEHSKFLLRLLRSSIPWIVCLRAKHKSRQTKDERGKTVIIKDEHTSPLQSEDFLFEMTVHGEILADHSFRITKWSHPSLKTCFPSSGPITSEHGKMLAQWCAAPGGSPSVAPTESLKELKRKLRSLAGSLWGEDPKDPSKFELWLIGKKIIEPDHKLAALTEDELREVLTKTDLELHPDS